MLYRRSRDVTYGLYGIFLNISIQLKGKDPKVICNRFLSYANPILNVKRQLNFQDIEF